MILLKKSYKNIIPSWYFIILCQISLFTFINAQAFYNNIGARTSFVVLEAEEGMIGNGATICRLQNIPANLLSSPELEASGRCFVELNATNEYVSFINPVDSCNAINIRQSIPDSPEGGGIDATLNLYVNGTFRQAISLTSKQTWVYDGNNGNNNGMSQTPSTGGPHVFYDEARTLIAGPVLKKGDTIMLKKDAENTANFYFIDCIDLEYAIPTARPSNSLSVADYGATGTSTNNVNSEFDACVRDAKSLGKSIWIPQGKYYLTNWSPNGVKISGAGMWFTTLYFTMGQLQAVSCTLQNFCVDAPTIVRDQGMGGVNIKGNNWLIDGVWSIHSCWAGFWASGTNGVIRNCRSSICWGDGLNLNNGTTNEVGINLLAENNFVRGCGDDGLTIFSDGGTTHTINGATLKNNTSIAMWWANGMRIAGGKKVRAENNLICDDVKEAGIYVGVFGANGSDLDSAIITNNVVIRCGNSRSPGGISVNASPGNKNVSAILSKNIIKDAQFYGICIGSNIVNLIVEPENIIDHPTQTAIYIQPGSVGSAYFNNNSLINRIPGKLAFKNDAATTFKVTFGNNIGFPDTITTSCNNFSNSCKKSFKKMEFYYKTNLTSNFYSNFSYKDFIDNLIIYNAAGRLIKKFSLNNNSFFIPRGKGIYILEIRQQKK